jgi:glutamate-1-semialdehyde 2,1-aminomutase
MSHSLPNSAALFERASHVLPGGVSRNTVLRGTHPIYVKEAKGVTVTDVDGIQRLDFSNNMSSLIHGHADPAIVAAVTEQLGRGTAFTLATEAEILFAEHMCGRSPNFDKIRFVNSGTEAVMTGIKAARAFTGRAKIAKVEGAYHGVYDYVEVSQGSTPANWGAQDRPNAVPLAEGTPDGVVKDVIVIPFDDSEAAIAILDDHRDSIACILVDPMPHRAGLAPIAAPFVQALRQWADDNGALLMFDEVVTFRSEVGGMQERLNIPADLTTMAKMIGGGFPVGALAGRHDVMDVFVKGERGLRLPLAGTFSANPVTMIAGRVAMERFDAKAVARLNSLGDYARDSLVQAIKAAGAPASVTGTGSLLRLHLKPNAPTDYRSAHMNGEEAKATAAFIDALYDNGIVLVHTCTAALSTPMERAHIDRLAESVLTSLRSIQDRWPRAA